ncbi:hypothetical protein JCM10908_000426 [Rhodotorula pacifica]|uniref:uncharacterized protein n=1 Tax=Rhodotorula pacifica TaxID=1495444 RepID=UPI00316E9CB0
MLPRLTCTVAAAIFLVVGEASAHMSIWHPSMYGVGPNWAYDAGAPTDPLGPGLQQDDWWFRGPKARSLTPQAGAVMELPAGGSITFEIACNYAFSSYGYNPSVPGSLLDACPTGAGPYHAGDPDAPDIDRSLVSGCALAIADVDNIDNINKVTTDNLAIFSVNHQCVQQKRTSFRIPAKMPKCTGSKCICGWFWLANNGTANFYMTAFDCVVTGSPADATAIAPPQDPVFCKNNASRCTKGSKRPIYAYNEPSNAPWIGNDDRAGYHASWSFGTNGAQNDIFVPASSRNVVSNAITNLLSVDTLASGSNATTLAPPSFAELNTTEAGTSSLLDDPAIVGSAASIPAAGTVAPSFANTPPASLPSSATSPAVIFPSASPASLVDIASSELLAPSAASTHISIPVPNSAASTESSSSRATITLARESTPGASAPPTSAAVAEVAESTLSQRSKRHVRDFRLADNA